MSREAKEHAHDYKRKNPSNYWAICRCRSRVHVIPDPTTQDVTVPAEHVSNTAHLQREDTANPPQDVSDSEKDESSQTEDELRGVITALAANNYHRASSITEDVDVAMALVQQYVTVQIEALLDRIDYAYRNPVKDKGYLNMGHVIEAERKKLQRKV